MISDGVSTGLCVACGRPGWPTEEGVAWCMDEGCILVVQRVVWALFQTRRRFGAYVFWEAGRQ